MGDRHGAVSHEDPGRPIAAGRLAARGKAAGVEQGGASGAADSTPGHRHAALAQGNFPQAGSGQASDSCTGGNGTRAQRDHLA